MSIVVTFEPPAAMYMTGRIELDGSTPRWGAAVLLSDARKGVSGSDREDKMASPIIPRQHVALTFTDITDQARHDLVAGVKQAATTSSLVIGNQGLQTSLAALLVKDTALTTSNTAVAADRMKLSTDLTTEVEHRSALDGEIRAYVSLVEGGAKTQADVTGAGLEARNPTPKTKLPPGMVEAIDTKFPKKGHGRATVSVHDTGKGRRLYVAEWSPEPYGPSSWAPLGIGYGKTRTLLGASGTKIWVRFATVRGQLQSDWCTPVLVTLP